MVFRSADRAESNVWRKLVLTNTAGPSPFPDRYEGCVFKTDFRVWLRYEHLIGLKSLSGREKSELAVKLCFKSLPRGAAPELLFKALGWFADCGEPARVELLNLPQKLLDDLAELNREAGEKPKVLSPFWDFKEIWASFRGQYGIDLYKVKNLHWWGYVALLKGLSPESPLIRLVRGRSIDPKKKPGKAEVILSKVTALPEDY